MASGHRLGGGGGAAAVVDDDPGRPAGDGALYPWALIAKDGHAMGDDCTVRLASDGAGTSPGAFRRGPGFRGRHGFDARGLHTHTVVSRTTTAGGADAPMDESPCCVIVRDPSDLDAADVTIAPGIDPLLMICYLASHSKMDVEPIMNGY